MSTLGWILVAIVGAIFLDTLVIWIWRLRRQDRLPALPFRRLSIPRWLPPVLIVAGAISLFLGQSLEAQFPATGTGSVPLFNLVGLSVFLLGAISMRVSRLAASSGKSAKGSKKVTRKKSKQTSTLPNIPNLELAALLLGAFLLLFIGRSMSAYLPEAERFWSYIYSALGLVLFLTAAVAFSGRKLPEQLTGALAAVSAWLAVTSAQVVLLFLAPFLALAAWLSAGDTPLMRSPILAVGSWLLAIAFIVVGSAVAVPRFSQRLRFSPTSLGVGALFLVAFLLRGLASGQAPWLFSGDEGSAGLSAVQFLDGFRDNIFGVAWFSFPSLFFYIQSLFIRVFGQTPEALRNVSALAGALTVPATFLFAREAFGKRVAWASAIYLAVFHFHIHFSRIGLNNIWDGLFVALFAGALWRAWKKNQRSAFLAAGLTLGISQYFYVSIRVMVPLIGLWLVAAAIKDAQKLKERLPGLSVLLLAAVVVALPLAIFFARHPQEFQAPLRRVAALGPWVQAEAQVSGRAEWQIMLDQFRYAALGFTSTNLRLAYEPNQPMLLALPATLFIMGLSLLLIRPRDLRSIWMALWLLGGIFVAALSLSPPASQRYILVSPAVAVLVALPLVTATDWLSDLWPKRRQIVTGVATALLTIAVWRDVSFYFGEYLVGPAIGDLNTETALVLAEMLADESDDTYVYFLGGRMGFRSHSSVPYLAPHIEGTDIPQTLAEPPELGELGHTIFIVLPERSEELAVLQSSYAGGRTFERYGRNSNLLFIGYEIQES
jgi:4-amino-4-deoxy-L-arabinose transferase-like glycosyltransferase